MNKKIRWLRDQLKSQNIQGMIVDNPLNVKYLTGIEAEGTLLLTSKDNIFITDSRYIEAVNSHLTLDDEIIVYNIKDISRYDYESFFSQYENIGFEEKYITYEQYKKYLVNYKSNNLIETEGIIENQRIVKEEYEVENIRKACEITDKCFTHIIDYIKIGMTEKEIAFEMESYMIKNGADSLAFETIVASGPNSSMPHAVPTNRKIEKGDCILLDFGCKYNGYCSDMTRTIFVQSIDEDVKEAYEFIRKLQEDILIGVKDGGNLKTLSKMFENELKLRNYQMLHALGHGVGLEVHELPFFTTKYDIGIKENMVLAVEPGLYIPGRYGIRIEDTVFVEKNNCIKLTKSEKNYIIIHG